jgi:phosphotransferase family enzyme
MSHHATRAAGDDHGELLPAGRMTAGITRHGDRVRRPMGSWSPAVHEFLRYLEAAGFDGAPRVLGTDGDTEVLTYLDGEVAMDPHWVPGHGHRLPAYTRTDAALAATGQLLRRLHEASAGFVPTRTGYRFHPHGPAPGEIIGHGDLGPWNTVYRDGLPTGFIDWDSAGPVTPLEDLADAAWSFVPLVPERQLAEAGFDPVPDLGERLRVLVDGYGLADRASIVPALGAALLAGAGQVGYLTHGPTGAADVLEHLAGQLRWLDRISAGLARALT